MSGELDLGIAGWLKNSFIDFPGTVSTVLFFGGCNLRCPWCHNPSIVNGESSSVDAREVFSWLEARKGLVDGVVLSGGEPTLHREALSQVVATCRSFGYKIKLDTNGLRPGMIDEVNPDYLAMDLKTVPCRYDLVGWKGNDPTSVLTESLNIVKKMDDCAEVRITVAEPFINESVIDELLPFVEGVHKVFLQPVNLSGELLEPDKLTDAEVSSERIRAMREKLAAVVGECGIRGER